MGCTCAYQDALKTVKGLEGIVKSLRLVKTFGRQQQSWPDLCCVVSNAPGPRLCGDNCDKRGTAAASSMLASDLARELDKPEDEVCMLAGLPLLRVGRERGQVRSVSQALLGTQELLTRGKIQRVRKKGT